MHLPHPLTSLPNRDGHPKQLKYLAPPFHTCPLLPQKINDAINEKRTHHRAKNIRLY
jgi:hypothetical protein